jgi:PBSX family phage terminase large subunit
MELTAPQAQIISDTHRFRVVCVGRRGGKTTLAIEEMKACAFAKARHVCYLAPTYQQARDIAWEQLKHQLIGIAKNINESRLEVKIWTQDRGESLIVLRGWESVETLRGQAFDFLVIDEVAMMRNFWLNWQEVLRPTLTDTKGQCLFISTPKGYNHFYDLYNLSLTDNNFASFHFTSYDNPYIPKEEIDTAKLQMTETRFEQEYMASFKKTEGLVYKEFDREKHLYDIEPIQRAELIAGVDFGFTHNAAVIHIVKDIENTYWVIDEWYHSGRTEDEIAEYISKCQFQRVYPDPESPSAIEQMRRKGVNIREVIKNKDSVISGINVVRELLKANKLFINKKCVNLISEFETYSYPDDEKVRNDEIPIKEHDDALDALRYALMSNNQVKVKATTFVPGSFIHPTFKPQNSSPNSATIRATTYIPKNL